MARRGGRRSTSKRSSGAGRPFALGAHWRADGAPKAAYPTQREALSVADERRQDTGVILSVYQCEFCAAWHMGSSSGRDT